MLEWVVKCSIVQRDGVYLTRAQGAFTLLLDPLYIVP